MERANNTEKATLRLDVDKLRRAEGDWLQVLVGVMDHVYALYRGAIKSGQRSVAEQVAGFQNACREVTRRVGLTPFVAKPQEAFNPDRHQFVEGNEKAPAGGLVGETLATGYTYQGRLVRPALVNLVPTGAEPAGAGGEIASTPSRTSCHSATREPAEGGGVVALGGL
jgi:molecular chaperone GrpE (heat shock protein)